MNCILAAAVCVGALAVPQIDTDFKAFMDYTAITNKKSPQYALQAEAYTDDNGLRKVGDYYCVALGSYYGTEIGQCYIITLDTGVSFKAILADAKADCDTDETHRYHPMRGGAGNIVEFVVDTPELPRAVRWSGTVSSIEGFEGSVESIEPVEYTEKCGS